MSFRMALGAIAILFLTPSMGLAQAIPDWDAPLAAAEFPEPVRSLTSVPSVTNAKGDSSVAAQVVKHPVMNPHRDPSSYRTDALVQDPRFAGQRNAHLHPHHVLVPTTGQSNPKSASRGHQQVLDDLKHHRPMQPPVAMLPESNRRPTWKTPYSYGHFGASGKRHWSLHNGYRDRVTEWRLR